MTETALLFWLVRRLLLLKARVTKNPLQMESFCLCAKENNDEGDKNTTV